MNDYLQITRNKLLSSDYGNLHLVLGNESCDLDSAVSSLVYATFLRWQYEQLKCRVCTRLQRCEEVHKDDIFVPVLNVHRDDYSIMTEVAYCFNQNGINESDLVFRNDINLNELIKKTTPRVYLVDHHVLSKPDQHLAPFVVEIIDHRPTERLNWPYKDDTRLTMEVVGSCATLVAQRIRDLSGLMSKDSQFFTAYPGCSDMLHSTIILDTVNFSKEVRKGTALDEQLVLFLETILNTTDSELERQRKLDALVCARKDVSRLTPAHLLKKDVKIKGDVLVPSFPMLVKEFLSRPGALQAVSAALELRECRAALLLGMDLSAGLARDAAVYCPTDVHRANELCQFLLSWKPSLELTRESPHAGSGTNAESTPKTGSSPKAGRSTNAESSPKTGSSLKAESSTNAGSSPKAGSSPVSESSPNSEEVFYFVQNNLTASRKQYMPALVQFLNQ